MTTNGDSQFAPCHVTMARHSPSQSRWAAQEAALEFGRFRVLLRRRQLVADGAPVKLGTRALDLLLVLLEAEGSLVTKGELLARVWPGIHVSDENLKLQVSALRKAFGEDRDFIRTEFGRGYRFTAAVKSTVPLAAIDQTARWRRPHQTMARRWINRRSFSACSDPSAYLPTVCRPRLCKIRRHPQNSGHR